MRPDYHGNNGNQLTLNKAHYNDYVPYLAIRPARRRGAAPAARPAPPVGRIAKYRRLA